MNLQGGSEIVKILKEARSELLAEWVQEQIAHSSQRINRLKEAELKEECGEFISLLSTAIQNSSVPNLTAPEWQGVRENLEKISRSRSYQGFSASETAIFIFSLKKPLFFHLSRELSDRPGELVQEMWAATTLLDNLGLWTTEIYQKAREEIIKRQQEELLELSTPVVKLWKGVLALPIIGTLDSNRTQMVMESLLEKIMETGSEIAIIDITGVPTVDTLTAQHLLKTVTAARLMGAECIISGIRPQIAQTLAYLGVTLGEVVTKASLADALSLALKKAGFSLVSSQAKL